MEKTNRTVTVTADASFDEKTLRAGFAVWVSAETSTRRFAGYVLANDSCEAELAALGNGIVYAVQELQLSRGDTIIARSDNQHAAGVLCGWTKPREDRTGDQHLRHWVRGVIRERGIILRSWYVAGHQGDRDMAAAIQGWCDSTARAALSMARVDGMLTAMAAQ